LIPKQNYISKSCESIKPKYDNLIDINVEGDNRKNERIRKKKHVFLI